MPISLAEWLDATLAVVKRELGFDRTSLVLVLAVERPEPTRAYAGTQRGINPAVLDEYFVHWADLDPLAGEAAREMFERQGFASTAELYDQLEPARRRFVDEFLAANEIADQLSVRLTGNGTTDGYLTVQARERVPAARQAELLALAPGLSAQLRPFLPRGLPDPLPPRERQTAELVALGFANDEIAAILNIDPETVKKHVYRTIRRLGLKRRTQLAVSWTTGRRVAFPIIQPHPG